MSEIFGKLGCAGALALLLGTGGVVALFLWLSPVGGRYESPSADLVIGIGFSVVGAEADTAARLADMRPDLQAPG